MIARKLGEIENLGHRTLACKCGIAMQKNRQDPLPVLTSHGALRLLEIIPAYQTLPCPGLTLDDCIDGFEVAGVGSK